MLLVPLEPLLLLQLCPDSSIYNLTVQETRRQNEWEQKHNITDDLQMMILIMTFWQQYQP